jgi:hypothetical protein
MPGGDLPVAPSNALMSAHPAMGDSPARIAPYASRAVLPFDLLLV